MNEGVGVHEVQERQYGGYGHGKGRVADFK